MSPGVSAGRGAEARRSRRPGRGRSREKADEPVAVEHEPAAGPLGELVHGFDQLVVDGDIVDAILAGACGYLLKDSPIKDLLRGISAAWVRSGAVTNG